MHTVMRPEQAQEWLAAKVKYVVAFLLKGTSNNQHK